MSNTDASPVKRKRVDYNIEKVTRPEPAVGILATFKANSNPFFETANVWTIDVFPNMVPIIMYIILSAIRHYGIVTNRAYSKITIPTLCMYYVCIVYGFFLINDLEVRPQPSAHARSWKDNSWKREFVNDLRSLPVPEFLTTILSQFHSTETDRTKNVFFVPSAAGYDHNQFFGRVFPVNYFAEIHDCSANLSSSSTKYQILQHLYARTLYRIGSAYTCIIPDLIGITIDQTTRTTANFMNSKLYQVFNCLFNHVQRCPTLAALSLEAPAYENEHINAYDMMFAATANNLRELRVVLQAVAAVIKPQIPCKGRLDDFIRDSSGNSILMHGYSLYALPTWSHSEEANRVEDFKVCPNFKTVTPTDRAKDFSFLQRPTHDHPIDKTHPVKDVTSPTDDNMIVTGVRHFPGSLRYNDDVDPAHVFPRHDNLVEFSDAFNTNPKVLVLDTEGNQGLTAFLATITGKVIESFEIDGTTIAMPTTDRSIGPQNAMFADSAIPYKYVRPGSHYRPRAADDFLPPLTRADFLPPLTGADFVPTTRLTASSLLCSRNTVMLPHFQTKIHEVLGNSLPGMTKVDGAVSSRYCQSLVGFHCCDGSSNTDKDDDVPDMPKGNLLVWSPYTYTSYESTNWPVPDLSQSRHYYLTNLRTIFGTDYNLVQVEHAYAALPVV